MLLEEVFNSLSNQTQVSNDNVYLDPLGKIVVFMEPGLGMEDPVGILSVPEGFNIFKLLNLTSYPEDIDGWRIVFKNGSFRYEKLDSVFQVNVLLTTHSLILLNKVFSETAPRMTSPIH